MCCSLDKSSSSSGENIFFTTFSDNPLCLCATLGVSSAFRAVCVSLFSILSVLMKIVLRVRRMKPCNLPEKIGIIRKTHAQNCGLELLGFGKWGTSPSKISGAPQLIPA